MPKPQIWVFGNPDYQPDALPLKILPALAKQNSNFKFITKDPNEEWDLPARLIIIDTILGLNQPRAFTSLDQFESTPRLTVHDFDLLTNLRWLSKLKKLPPFLIIGLPPTLKQNDAISAVNSLLPGP